MQFGTTSSNWLGLIVVLLIINVAVATLYAMLPVDVSLGRGLLAGVQFVVTLITVFVAARWILEDF